MSITRRKKIGDLLKDSGLVTEKVIEEALEKRKSNQKLGRALVEQGYITEKQLLDALEVQLKVESVSLYRYPIDKALAKLVSKEFARKNLLIPIQKKENHLTVAMNDPLDFYAIEELELGTGFYIDPVIATRDEILQAINQIYDLEDQSFENLNDTHEAPAVQILDQLLEIGLAMHASDIHLDPQEEIINVRYRVDGTLSNERQLPISLLNSLISRIKIISGLNITETRLPQDGRVRTKINDTEVNLRISTLPTVFGEKIVIRILDMANVFTSTKKIGLQEDALKEYEELIKQPSGLILITGPTGSGKTSTLYGSINELNREEVNIVTVEDPVEYQLTGINQVQVNPAIDLTFATGLRSILRQDPNIIMVGEIRDQETAEISIRSALTGHLVFSTLHTNSAIDAIPRLLDMGIEPYLIVSALNGVMAQRLVRRVCKDCQTTREASLVEQEIFAKRNMTIKNIILGAGCDACRYTGYRGRIAIHELIIITDEIKALMMNKASVRQIKDHVIKSGVRFLVDDGLQKVKQGQTTLEEVLRVASLED